MALNKAMLRLVTGEDVCYGLFDEWLEADTILMEIKDKPFIKVTDKKEGPTKAGILMFGSHNHIVENIGGFLMD